MKNKKLTKQVTVRIGSELEEVIKKVSEGLGVSFNAYVTQALLDRAKQDTRTVDLHWGAVKKFIGKGAVVAVACFLFSGCGSGLSARNVDPRLTEYLDRFQRDASSYGVSVDTSALTLRFGSPQSDEGSSVAGSCQHGGISGPIVTITNDSGRINWDLAADSFKESLVYHELGHCLLGLGHDSNHWKPDGVDFSVEESVMYPALPVTDSYIKFHTHYLKQLFTGVNLDGQ